MALTVKANYLTRVLLIIYYKVLLKHDRSVYFPYAKKGIAPEAGNVTEKFLDIPSKHRLG